MTAPKDDQRDVRFAARLDALALLCFILLFIAILLTGNPIPALGDTFSSLVYSLVVVLPVIAVLCLAIARSR